MASEYAESFSRQVIAIIPARGGSKRLPDKNIYLLHGKPLIAYSIMAAKECSLRCVVSTEDQRIKDIALSYGAEVIDRPQSLATDTAKSRDVVRHALLSLDNVPEYCLLLQPTSPLRNAKHIQRCIGIFIGSGANSCVSVTKAEHHPFKMVRMGDSVHPLFDTECLDKPDQQLPPVYRLNGAIYILPVKLFLEKHSFFVNPILPFVMDQDDSVDINTDLDMRVASIIMEGN